MSSQRLNALAEGLGLSRAPVDLGSAPSLAPVPSAMLAVPESGEEPEHVTALRMNVRYFLRTSIERYGHSEDDLGDVMALEDEILASDRYALSYFEQPQEVQAVPLEMGAAPRSLWLDSWLAPELAPIPTVFGDPAFLPENDYRDLVATDESRRAIEDEAPNLWISRMRYFEDTFGFRYRVTYVDEVGREQRVRSFTSEADEIFRVMTEVPVPGWKIDELAVSCHCDGKGFYGTTRDPANWKDKVHSRKIYAREADRPDSRPPGEKCEPFGQSLESRAEAFQHLYTADARIVLLMCWSVRVHNVILDRQCGKDVHYFDRECWISPFKLDLRGWYFDVPSMRPGFSPSGRLPKAKNCAQLARELLLGGG